MSKHFVINPYQEKLSKEDIFSIDKEREVKKDEHYKNRDNLNEKLSEELIRLNVKHTVGRVIVTLNTDLKNNHTFSDGTKIRLERNWENLDRKHVAPVNAIVVSADGIPTGAEILVHPNASHDVNRIFNLKPLNTSEIASDVKVYSIPVEQCFLWRKDSNEWQPTHGFVIAERIFEPYKGFLTGIEPKQIKNVLYIKTGELKGKVVHTLKACDYQIQYQDTNGQEGLVIRARHYENEYNAEREEMLCINNTMTEQVQNGELLIGYSPTNCRTLNDAICVK